LASDDNLGFGGLQRKKNNKIKLFNENYSSDGEENVFEDSMIESKSYR
jgi:hypothetical protein